MNGTTSCASGPGVGGCSRPSATFTVSAGSRWNPTNFAVQAGETYVVEVGAGETWGDLGGEVLTDAEGYESSYDVVKKCNVANGRCGSYLRNKRR